MTEISAEGPLRILSPTAILGYGFPEASFQRGLNRQPHVIAVDAGSSDPGPYYLGAGESFTNRDAVYRDLKLILEAGRRLDIPVVIGSAGGAGARPHLDWTVDIVREIARNSGLTGRLAVIGADVDRSAVTAAFDMGRLQGVVPEQPLSLDDISQSTHIVAQMGEAPLIAALQDGADVVVAGRCYDPSVFAALPISLGYDRGLALHLGKILECAAIAAVPGGGSDCMLGTLYADSFELEPMSPDRVCTITSVAAHTLYEKSNPFLLPGPGGYLDLSTCAFEQLDERRVRVSGSRFVPVEPYTVKLEGARPTGFRTISIAGTRDPVFIAKVDEIVHGVRERVADNFSDVAKADFTLHFHLYGRDGVMGAREPMRGVPAHELGIIIDVAGKTQRLADTICSFARSTMLHFGYAGRISTAGNLALPYSPSDFQGGAIYAFSLYHLMPVADAFGLFPCEMSALESVA